MRSKKENMNVMEPYAFSASKWGPRSAPPAAAAAAYSARVRGLQELFQDYGVSRLYTAAKLAELGFTVNTLLNMKDEELDEMMDCLCRVFRWDLVIGERHGIKAAVGAERRRLFSADAVRALGPRAQRDEGPMQKHRESAGSSGGGLREVVGAEEWRRLRVSKNNKRGPRSMEGNDGNGGGGGSERRREHPFVVTVPGEVARGKKNGLDHLFNLYEQCRQFLIQFQNSAKERGQKYPTKVTNQVFRYAQLAGASYINKPKMRHYVHCYALHCLDEATSDALRTTFKMRNEGVGAWRQACYSPLVAIAAGVGWDIDAIFSLNPRLSIWYVPAKLRQLCHSQRLNNTPRFRQLCYSQRLNTTPRDATNGEYEL